VSRLGRRWAVGEEVGSRQKRGEGKRRKRKGTHLESVDGVAYANDLLEERVSA